MALVHRPAVLDRGAHHWRGDLVGVVGAGPALRVRAPAGTMTRGYLAQLEAGHKTNPSLPTPRKLAKAALGLPVMELLG